MVAEPVRSSRIELAVKLTIRFSLPARRHAAGDPEFDAHGCKHPAHGRKPRALRHARTATS